MKTTIAITLLVALSPLWACGTDETVDAGPNVAELSRTALEAAEPVLAEEPLTEETVREPEILSVVAEEQDPVETFEIAIRSGENLVLLAEWAGTSVESIVDVNALDARSPLYPGQSLLMPLTDDGGPEALTRARNAALDRKLERYVARRGGLVGVSEHRVRTGETAWHIARDQIGIPSWVLAAYNREADLNRLSIGEVLMLPVFVDTVAEAMATDDAPDGSDSGIEEETDEHGLVRVDDEMQPRIGPLLPDE